MNPLRARWRWRLLDAGYLIALMIYMIAGMSQATFHGDEAMQIHMSRDYVTAFWEHAPERLLTTPPYAIDSDAQLRILNGFVNRYLIGLSWHVAGFSPDDLPPPPGWDWGLSYDENLATGHRPPDTLLASARLPSTLGLALGAVVLFALGLTLGGRPLAYCASLLYTLNPALLLNGRRATQEGALLLFGLLTVLVAAALIRRVSRGQTPHPALWGGLALAAGLALASKHSAVVFVAAAFAGLLPTSLTGARRLLLPLIGAALGAGALFVALSPALWNDPPARLGDLLAVRAELLDIQVAIDPAAPLTLPQRALEILRQPFLAPVAHYELPWTGDSAALQGDIAHFAASPLNGLPGGGLAGALLTVAAAVGVVGLVWPRLLPAPLNNTPGLRRLLVIALAAVVLSLLATPLPWQRYFLPLIPLAALLAGIGLQTVWQRVRRAARRRSSTPADAQSASPHPRAPEQPV